jgi:hypothetical protein
MHLADNLLDLLLDPEYGNSAFLRNVGQLPDYTPLRLTKWHSSEPEQGSRISNAGVGFNGFLKARENCPLIIPNIMLCWSHLVCTLFGELCSSALFGVRTGWNPCSKARFTEIVSISGTIQFPKYCVC